MSNISSLIPDELRARITKNYIESERAARLTPFHFLTFCLVGLVAIGALVVDYMIVSEFWTRALANEFLELPGALGSSVAFKSMQVLFATVAAHILYEQLGAFGKALFVRIVFLLALAMLLGVGVLLALMSLPSGIASSGEGGVGASLANTLAGLGIASDAGQESARVTSELDRMREWQPLGWLASLGIVFLVVTGVAALCIHYAANALRRIFDVRDFRQRHTDMARLASLEAEHDRNRHALAELEGPENRRHMLWAGLMRECQAYEQGLEEARRACQITSTPMPSSRRLLGRRTVANDNVDLARAQTDKLKACEASRGFARYEGLFDEWWERRSRHAMKAGPARMEAIREPASEVLPPSSPSLRLSVRTTGLTAGE